MENIKKKHFIDQTLKNIFWIYAFLVDGEGGSLHSEVDPRYRGAAIPSRAFRALQTMTGETDDPGSFPNVWCLVFKIVLINPTDFAHALECD